MILHLHRAGHRTYTRQKNHGVSLPGDLQVDADGRRRSHPCGHGGRQARRRPVTVRASTTCCASRTHPDRSAARPVLRAGLGRAAQGDAGGLRRHPRRPDAPAARPISATTSCCSSVAARSATRWASRPARPRTASRSKRWCSRATKAATSGTKARRSWRRPRRWCQPLQAALDTWGDVTFNYTSTDTRRLRATAVDRVSVRRRPHATSPKAPSRSCPISPTSRSSRRSSTASTTDWACRRRVHRRSAPAQHVLGDVGQADVRPAAMRPASWRK